MITIKDISEPTRRYKEISEAIKQNATEFYDELVKQAGVNIEGNKATCKEYYAKTEEVQKADAYTNKLTKKKKWLRFLEVVCFILVITIPFAILIHNKIKNKINVDIEESGKRSQELQKQAGEIKDRADKESAPLNSLYDWNMVAKIFDDTFPLIKLDQYFNNRRFYHLAEKYGYKSHENEMNISTIFVQSGEILGNPFVIEKNYVQEMYQHVYTGSLVIHWTTTERDSNGGMRTVHHSQTLVAHVSKPAPTYFYDTWLIYGNGAAPKLTFSRSPSNANNMSDEQIKKASKKFEKELEKISKKDATFTQMANTEFETMFKALDRNNEVEYRLLFTPLAQRNMLELIKTNEPFGDDFYFFKRNCLNFIKTKHSQSFDYSGNPNMFKNFDMSISKETFINYCSQYFESLYFDLAPLLSIPLYQNYKDKDYIYKDNHKHNYPASEIESLVNTYNKNVFNLTKSVTDLILKAKYISSSKNDDNVEIIANGFTTTPHTEFVMTMGGDGHMHSVPVHWLEYIPISNSTNFKIYSSNENMRDFYSKNNNSNVYYQKGLVSQLLANSKK